MSKPETGNGSQDSGCVDDSTIMDDRIIPAAAWVTLKQTKLLSVITSSTSKKVTPVQLKVLLHLIAKMQFSNWIFLAQTELAPELGMCPQAYNRALRGLEKSGVIVRPKGMKTTAGVRTIIRVDPKLVFKGKSSDLSEAIRKFDESIIKKAKIDKNNDNIASGHNHETNSNDYDSSDVMDIAAINGELYLFGIKEVATVYESMPDLGIDNP